MDIEVRHAVTYGTKGSVPVRIVADSLLANERLLIDAVRLIGDFTPGLEVSSISVKVALLSNESPLREILVAALFLRYQQDLNAEVPALIERLTGYHVQNDMSALVTVMVVGTAFYAISAAIERVMPGKSIKRLMDEYERKIDRVSELSGADRDTIKRYTEAKIERDDTFAKRALSFFSPAKIEGGTEIFLPNGEVIPSAVIDEIPSAGDFEMISEEARVGAYELKSVVIDIHRTDRDETRHGWRAIIDTVSDRKVRMTLAPDIEPESLYGKRTIVGDVLVEDGRLRTGDIAPVAYHVLRVSDGEKSA